MRGLATVGIFLIAIGAITCGKSVARSATLPYAAWRVQPSGTGVTLQDIACPLAVRCFAIGDRGTIRFTVNGGRTWLRSNNPLVGTTTRLIRVACPAPDTCYAATASGTVLVTIDGGHTWTRHTVHLGAPAATLTDLACPTRRACFVTVSPNAIFLSTDLGSTWIPQVIPQGMVCTGDCHVPMSYPLQWISCRTVTSCIAGGTQFVASNEGFLDVIITTRTIGGVWTAIWPRNSVRAAVCPSPVVCYGLSGFNPISPGQWILISRDRDHLWLPYPTGTRAPLNDLTCLALRHCFGVGQRGVIVGTENGRTFLAQRSPTGNDLLSVNCAPSGRCWGVGMGGTIVASP